MTTEHSERIIMAASIMRLLADDKVVGSLLLQWAKRLEKAASENEIDEVSRIKAALPVVTSWPLSSRSIFGWLAGRSFLSAIVFCNTY